MNQVPGTIIFRFCPECGSDCMDRSEKNVMRCTACGFQFFINSSAAVVALIKDDDNRILLTRRAKEPAKGLWDLPGGFVDPGETVENAVKREIKEELNLDVAESVYLGSTPGTYCFSDVTYQIINLIFLCRVDHLDALRAGDDVSEIIFLKKDEIKLDQIGLESIRSVLRDMAVFRIG